MKGDLEDQFGVWDEWLFGTRLGQDEHRDLHTDACARAVLRELSLIPPDKRRAMLDASAREGCDSDQFGRLGGHVAANDLASATMAHTQTRYSHAGAVFISGDFLSQSFAGAPYDVIVSLETIAHVKDQQAFVQKAADLLGHSGHLILTTRNRAVCDYCAMPPTRGYLPRWVDRAELTRLLIPCFDIKRVYTISPPEPGTVACRADGRSPPPSLRMVSSFKANALIGSLVTTARLEEWKEKLGMGRTLVAVARVR